MDSYVKDIMSDTVEEGCSGELEGEHTRLVRAWVKDMRDNELNLQLKEDFTERDWGKFCCDSESDSEEESQVYELKHFDNESRMKIM